MNRLNSGGYFFPLVEALCGLTAYPRRITLHYDGTRALILVAALRAAMAPERSAP